MQSGKNQVAGFGGSYRDAHSFRVAHFADYENVRRLSQGRAESGGEIGSVRADFYLLDDAVNVFVLVLDGIFDGENVPGFILIDFVNDRGERGGFGGACGTADQHKSARKVSESFDRGRKV